ncbi:UNKNOWN [Stylonychia lemnae]|uniref:Uncharacterized protein n=1 Tax=Stylonychia lemnae TaxID=5949 RepID=A0A078AMW0_STYLE|nr:UNKNOWN [Stylonychia lemnae]|eukprot:CDW82218.1 UNKNOWN [Stylonychia lemnae]
MDLFPTQTVVKFSMFNNNSTKSAVDIKNKFKNIPNLQTRGQTFDVRHLDQFIQFDNSRTQHQQLQGANHSQNGLQITNFGAMGNNDQQASSPVKQESTIESGRMSLQRRAQTAGNLGLITPAQMMQNKRQSKLSSIPVVYTNVRPSTSFISVPRENVSQIKYIDEQKGGPSFLLKRDGVPTLKSLENDGSVQLHYNTERKNFKALNNDQKIFNAKIVQFQGKQDEHGEILIPNADLKYPSQRRQEIYEAKEAFKNYQEIKSQKIFIKKRNRLIQNGWRNGIVGVEVPGDQGSLFYSQKILRQQERSMQRLEKRNEYLKEKAGQSCQIDFYNNDKIIRNDSQTVQMFHGWKSKQISNIRFKNTQESLFGDIRNKWNNQRAQKLVYVFQSNIYSQEETKGRPFNPISGINHYLIS